MASTGFEFGALLGATYTGGRVAFSTTDGAMLAPVGARVLSVDTAAGRSRCLPLEALDNVRSVVPSPSGRLALLIDAKSRSVLVDLASGVALHHFTFPDAVRDCRWSPDGLHIAAACGRHVRLYRAPRPGVKKYAPFARLRTFGGYADSVACLDWSPDSRLVLAACDDTTVKVHSLAGVDDGAVATFVGHRAPPAAAFFVGGVGSGRTAAVVSTDGAVYMWARQDAEAGVGVGADGSQPGWGAGSDSDSEGGGGEEGGAAAEEAGKDKLPWRLSGKHYFMRGGTTVTSCDCHRTSGLLLTGFSDGTFALHRLPAFEHLQSLSVSRGVLDATAISPSGDKLALGCSELGQLLVWDWRSESYALRQQGHRAGASAVAWAPDSATLATAGDDGKVKVWSRDSGMCFVTFSDHAAAVTALQFMPNGHALVSASLDGTVRAFDLVRYRNFRTFAAPHAAQFVSVAVDGGGEVVAAGTLDPFKIFVWSLRTGQLLSALAGHEGPVYSLAFMPLQPVLASGSWDKTVRLWNIFSGEGCIATLRHSHEVLALAPRPDGKQLATATLNGELHFWDADDGELKGVLECRRDIGGHRGEDRSNRCFRSLSYSSDGTMVLAAGKARQVCLYDIADKVLLRRWEVGPPLHSLGYHSAPASHQKGGPRAGLRDGLGLNGYDAEADDLPGLSAGSKTVSDAPGAACVRFSADGRSWAAATALGTMLFSLDTSGEFGPVHLGEDITPVAYAAALREERWARALALAAQLGSEALLVKALLAVPAGDRAAAAEALPKAYLARVLVSVAGQIDGGAHLEVGLRWAHCLLRAHGHLARSAPAQLVPAMRSIKQAVTKHQQGLAEMAEQNAFSLLYLSQQRDAAPAAPEAPMEED